MRRLMAMANSVLRSGLSDQVLAASSAASTGHPRCRQGWLQAGSRAAANCILTAPTACEQRVPGTAFLLAPTQQRRKPTCRIDVTPRQHAITAWQLLEPHETAASACRLARCSCHAAQAAGEEQPHGQVRSVGAHYQLLPKHHQFHTGTHAATASIHGSAHSSSSSSRKQAAPSSAAVSAAAGTRAPNTSNWVQAAATMGVEASNYYTSKRLVDMSEEDKHQLLREKLADAWEVGDLPELQLGEHRVTCPECGNGSRHEDCFAVLVEEDAIKWCCHRASCGYKGAVYVHGGREASSRDVEATVEKVAKASMGSLYNGGPEVASTAHALWQQQQQWRSTAALGSNLQPLVSSPELLQWFEQRGIHQATLERNGVMCELRYNKVLGRQELQMAFPYRKNGTIVNIKYRSLEKHFTQSKGGEQIFYGYDDVKGARDVIIVEGELDKLAVEQALMWEQQQQQQQLSMQPRHPGEDHEADEAAAAAAGADGVGQLNGIAVLSVPSGAPSTGASGQPGSLDRKFKYLYDCSALLAGVERFILAVDSDGPGLVLAEELARRLGRERCWRVTWPTGPHDSLAPGAAAAAAAGAPVTAAATGDTSSAATAAAEGVAAGSAAAGSAAAGSAAADWARKDANEVLMKDGAEVLCAYLDAAQPLPIHGLFRFDDFWPQVYDLYQQGPRALNWGVSTGWDSVDACYKVVPGELSIVTGLPNMGKSEWLDALTVNLARHKGWRFALCSMENPVVEHGRKLIEKYSGKAFFNAEYSRGTTKMDADELIDALLWLDVHFHIIRPAEDRLPTIDYILDRARTAVLRYGIHGLVIDPYNELDTHRPAMFSETEHVSRMLTKIKRFAQHFDVHVWFVAHPRTQRFFQRIGGGPAALPAPTMYDISGSAHFINKADNGIVVHRPYASAQEGQDPFATQVLVRKVRNKLAGKIGDAVLRYDKATGSYKDC